MTAQVLTIPEDLLKAVESGLEVYDSQHNRVGQVEEVWFPKDSEVPTIPGEFEDLPQEVQSRLLRAGFIKIGAGFLRPDRYAMTHQIVYVDYKAVYLSVERDQLVKGK